MGFLTCKFPLTVEKGITFSSFLYAYMLIYPLLYVSLTYFCITYTYTKSSSNFSILGRNKSPSNLEIYSFLLTSAITNFKFSVKIKM